jgi:hypothetical protein
MHTGSKGGQTAGLVLMAAVLGCGSEPSMGPSGGGDDVIATVAVTSPIGEMMAAGRQLQLSAAAATSSGGSVTTSFSWMSSNDAVASVSGSGLVAGLGPGPATITATANGVSGELTLTVVDADLDGIERAVTDAYVAHLVSGVSSNPATTLNQLFGECATAVGEGHIINLAACLESARNTIVSPSTPDDMVLFAYLDLFLAHAQLQLNLD